MNQNQTQTQNQNKIYLHQIDSVKRMVNGKIVDDTMLDASYDGANLDIKTIMKGKRHHVKLDNKDIMKLMSKPASSMSLEKRLMQDFKVKTGKKKSMGRKSMGRKSRKLKGRR